MKIHLRTGALCGLATLALAGLGCGSDEVDSEKEARAAYEGLDGLVETSIDLGFKGMNATNGATIPPQTANGTKSGTVTVSGKVDQGTSDNKNMDLNLALAMFSKDGKITYATPAAEGAALPRLVLSLKKLPNGTLTGMLTGDFAMSGDLKGNVTLNLTVTATLEPDPATMVRRKPGTTHITGTAVSRPGTYNVDITR